MNNLVIPPSPNWYESKILACATDNTVIYGAKRDIVVIKNKSPDSPADIKIFTHAHYERIVSIDVTLSWGPGSMWTVSCSEDKIIKLWNMEDYSWKSSNSIHTSLPDKLVGAVFAGNDKIIAVSENGFVSVWRVATNDITSLKSLFNFKVQVTTLSVCPHSPWLAAFGLKCGLVVLADLRKSGKILYKMRGHDKQVVSLSWCPLPFNIFQKVPQKKTLFNKGTITHHIKEDKAANVDFVDAQPFSNQTTKNIQRSNGDVSNGEQIISASLSNCTNKEGAVFNEAIRAEVYDNRLDNQRESIITSELQSNLALDIATNVNYYINHYMYGDDKKIEENTSFEENLISTEDSNHLNSTEKIVEVLNVTNEAVIIEKENLDIGTNVDKEETQLEKEFLLASSSRGGSIYIWRAGTDGRKQIEMVMTNSKNKRNYRSSDKTWITLCWITPTSLLSSSPSGELIQWDLLGVYQGMNKPQRKLIHHDHGSTLFAITAPVELQSKLDVELWRTRKDLFAWTVGQERFLLCTSLQADRTTIASYPTLGGYVYCLSCCPIDPNRIAVGIGDSTAKVWDLSRPHTQCIIMTNLWQKIHSKVLTLAWHPTKETILAYGTFEGRIGLINPINTGKMPLLLNQYFRTAVNEVVWGPLKGNLENMGLYACGEQQLVIYNIDKPMNEPEIMKIPSNEIVTCMSWKPDFKLFSVGTKAGTILVFNKNRELTTAIYAQHKMIYATVWHPEATAEDDGISPYSFWLAASTSDGSVIVYDLSKEKGDGEDTKDYRMIAVLTGHTRPVKCLCWSSYDGGKLVSGGDDGVAQVWDVKTATIISTFTSHNVEPILTVLWSPLNKDFIISGGKDNSIRIWNVTENQPMNESDLAEMWKERGKIKRELKKHKATEGSDDEEAGVKIKRGAVLTLTAKAQNNMSTAIEDCKRVFSLVNDESCENLDDNEKLEIQNNSYFDVSKLFGAKNDVLELLNLEQELQVQKKKYNCSQQISLWKGDIAETIKESIRNETVNSWLVSVAPMVSPKLWQEACEAYATKLSEDSKSDPFETVTYLLACHKVEEAINVFCNATLYREALALAKCRLAKGDPTIAEVLKKWADFSVKGGIFEIAAQCYMVLGQYEDAARLLVKRKDLKTLEFALKLAQKSGNKDLESAILLTYSTAMNNAATLDDSKNVIDESKEISNNDINGETVEKMNKTDAEKLESEGATTVSEEVSL